MRNVWIFHSGAVDVGDVSHLGGMLELAITSLPLYTPACPLCMPAQASDHLQLIYSLRRVIQIH